ncbi:MAG: hypothetical protein AB9861_13320 [Methanosarcina sp.]
MLLYEIDIELTEEIHEADGINFYLPNSVAVLNNNNIVVADGGNDRICLLDSNGETVKCIGKKGFNRYYLKEPVGAFVSPDQKIYVADWHNHRFVIYDQNLNYYNEFGHFGNLKSNDYLFGKISRVFKFLTTLAYSGSCIGSHFMLTNECGIKKIKRHNSKINLFLNSLLYWFKRNKSLITGIKMMYSNYDAINKPNGIAFITENKIIISQKNNNCITEYTKKDASGLYSPVKNYFGPSESEKYGRVGNITYGCKNFIYICDERSNVVWKLDQKLKFVEKIIGLDSGIGKFLPFSCTCVCDNIIALCGGLNFQIIDVNEKEVLYCSENMGELHGISYNYTLKKLYIADRFNGVIKVFNMQINEKE